jgi:uncharacterized protein YgiM (DUF1202 family)
MLSFIVLFCAIAIAQDDVFEATIQSIKQQYAPDSRLAVFDITYKNTSEGILMRGEVDNPEAKTSLLTALKNVTNVAIIDKIRLLPAKSLGINIYGIATLSVGNIRLRPGESKELTSQVLMGTTVKLLKKSNNYWFVQLPDRYLGWLDNKSFAITDKSGSETWVKAPKVIVTDYFGIVHEQPSTVSPPVCDVVIGCLLIKIGAQNDWTFVELADNRQGYIQNALVQDYDVWKQSRKLTAENIEMTAKMLLGIPYLWGGTSVKGMDCSGFTKMVYWLNGTELLRDANQQVTMGTNIESGSNFKNLKKGDLLFFSEMSSDEVSERITHVGIYLDKKLFIHSSGRIRYGSFDSASQYFEQSLMARFVCARRIIQE